MNNQSFSDKVSQKFIDYLAGLDVSERSIKHYKSDLSHFTAWILFKIRAFGVGADELTQAIPFLNNQLASEYKIFMTENKIPTKTANRRLTTLRHLSRYLIESQIIESDFMLNISNLSVREQNRETTLHPLITEFEKHLEKEKVSHNTTKNYISDLRQFFSWLEQNHLLTND